jgi:glycosyltransferase involved in cell wall biosynthesis
MHACITIFFRAPLGGLQGHVRGQVQALLRDGHRCTVVSKPGPFADDLRHLGADVFETDYSTVEDAAARVAGSTRFDFVHAHPYASRRLGLLVARAQRIPFAMTLHGTDLDSLRRYGRELDLLVAVSEGVRDFVVRSAAIAPERVVMIPNGCDREVFRGRHSDWDELRDRLPTIRDVGADDRRIAVVSRFDTDKRLVVDALVEAWRRQAASGVEDVGWVIAGDGSLKPQLETAAADLGRALGRPRVDFAGWFDAEDLVSLYSGCHVAVTHGRGALEAMACGTPLVALGRHGYLGLIDGGRALPAAYHNFGDFGTLRQEGRYRDLWDDLHRAIRDPEALARASASYADVMAGWFDQRDLDARILRTWSALVDATPRNQMGRGPRAPLPHRWRSYGRSVTGRILERARASIRL